MSLLYMSGFEGAPKLGETPPAGATYPSAGRTGYCMQIPGGQAPCAIAFPTAKTEFVMGVAAKTVSYDPSQTARINLVGNEGVELDLRFEGAGTINARTISYTAPIVAAPSAYPTEQWFYLELHYKASQTTGRIELWINGNKVMDFTGDTMAMNSTGINSIHLQGPGGGTYAGSLQFDDFYLLDMVDATATQGRPFNAPLGMPRIEALLPVASGPTNEWVGSDGNSVDNHALVDEMPPSGTDYVESSTTGQRELYDFANPTISGDILAVDVVVHAQSPDGGVNPVRTVRRSAAGTADVGPGFSPGGAFRSASDGPKGKDPDGALWTPASVGSATFGFEVG